MTGLKVGFKFPEGYTCLKFGSLTDVAMDEDVLKDLRVISTPKVRSIKTTHQGYLEMLP